MKDLIERLQEFIDIMAPAGGQRSVTMCRDAIAEIEHLTQLLAEANKGPGDGLLYAMQSKKAEIERLTAERDAALVDAKRYRWLRSTTNSFTNNDGDRIDVKQFPEQWDATIDAAIAKEPSCPQ